MRGAISARMGQLGEELAIGALDEVIQGHGVRLAQGCSLWPTLVHGRPPCGVDRDGSCGAASATTYAPAHTTGRHDHCQRPGQQHEQDDAAAGHRQPSATAKRQTCKIGPGGHRPTTARPSPGPAAAPSAARHAAALPHRHAHRHDAVLSALPPRRKHLGRPAETLDGLARSGSRWRGLRARSRHWGGRLGRGSKLGPPRSAVPRRRHPGKDSSRNARSSCSGPTNV